MTSAAATAAACLAKAQLPAGEADLLLGHILKRNRAWLRAFPEARLNPEQLEQFDRLVQRRRRGEPIAYLLGEKEFWSLPLRVSKHVLIPRPETELLIELAIEQLPPDSAQRLLDLGTGSGAIALAIASERPQMAIVAVDASLEALGVATSNAKNLGLDQVTFLQTNWYSELENETFDVIVSNPPYISKDDAHLNALKIEPSQALVAAKDGLADLQTIIANAKTHLNANGRLLVEHGHRQQLAVSELFARHGFADIQTHNDLAGRPRVVSGRKT